MVADALFLHNGHWDPGQIDTTEQATLADVAFVGEGFNDGPVARSVGLSIAYPPTATGLAAAADVRIEADDLTSFWST